MCFALFAEQLDYLELFHTKELTGLLKIFKLIHNNQMSSFLHWQDIASKIMAFSQQGPRTVCILSANGAVSDVTLRQPAISGGTVTYEV